MQRVAELVRFPWQGAMMIAVLTAGATIHQRPEMLRPVLVGLHTTAARTGLNLASVLR